MPAIPLTLGRDPEQDARTRRFMQIVQSMLNGLAETGAIKQTGPEGWTLPLADLLDSLGGLTGFF